MQAKVEFLTAESELAGVREEWRALAKRSPNPHVFCSVEWFEAWRHAFGQNKKIGLLRVARDSEVVAFQPLMIVGVRRGPALSALYDYTAEDVGFLEQRPRFRFVRVRQLSGLLNLEAGNIRSLPLSIMPEMNIADLVQYFNAIGRVARWDVARLLCKDSELHSYLRALREAGVEALAKRHFMPLYALKLKPWDDFLAARSRNFRKNFRHAIEQGAKENKQFISKAYIGSDQIEWALDRLFALARRSWKNTGREGESVIIPLTERGAEFYRHICLTPSSEVVPYIQLIFDGDTLFGGALTLFYKDRLFGCQTYFDPEYARFSPGRLLFREMIEHGYAYGASIMDLNGGSEFVARFSDFSDNYHQILVFNKGAYGRLLHACAKRFSNDLLTVESFSASNSG